jgi:hypothetical protein
MALTTIPGLGFWLPQKQDETYAVSGATYVMDASGEKVTVTFMAPKTGTLTRFEMLVATLTNAPDNGLKCSFQTVDGSTGLPTGTIMGSGSAHVTTAGGSPSAAGWFNPGDFGASVAVTAGDVLSAVVEFGGAGFTAGDSVAFGHLSRTGDLAFPFGASAAGTKQASTFPIIALRYNDGTYAMVEDEIWPVIADGEFTMDTGTAKNEFGMRFSLPVAVTLRALNLYLGNDAVNGACEVYLYDSGGTNIMPNGAGGTAALAVDGDHASSGVVMRWKILPIPEPVTIAANTEYIVGVKPTTTINTRMVYYTVTSSALMDAIPGGSNFYAVDRAWSGGTPGAWTRYNNGTDGYRRPRVLLGISQLHGAGGGGGSFGGKRPLRVSRVA